MIRTAIFIAVALSASCAFAQPQRIERNVARSKATLAQALAEVTWKDGELVTTQGYVTAGDGGGNTYRYRRTGRSGITVDGGFYIAGGGADDYFEAVDKTVARPDQFGVDGVGDDSVGMQACFDAAIARGCSVKMPPFAVTASVDITAAGEDLPSIIGTPGKSEWYAPAASWCLQVNVSGVTEAKPIEISGITFRQAFGANTGYGVYLNTSGGPVAFRDCDFRYLKLGVAYNGSYSITFENTFFTANTLAVLSTCRIVSNPITVGGTAIALPTPLVRQHSGIGTFINCSFSSNTNGIIFEDPDRNVGAAHLETTFINTIHQGDGLQVWVRSASFGNTLMGLVFQNSHFEGTDITTNISIDGETVKAGEILQDSGSITLINCKPNSVRQNNESRIESIGAGAPLSGGVYKLHEVESADCVFFKDIVTGYQSSYPNVTSNVSLPGAVKDLASTDQYLSWTNTSTRIPAPFATATDRSVIKCITGDLPLAGTSTSRTVVSDTSLPYGECVEVVLGAGQYFRFDDVTTSVGELRYTSFMMRLVSGTNPSINMTTTGAASFGFVPTSEWRTYHASWWNEAGAGIRTQFTNNSAGTITVQVAMMQNVTFDSVDEVIQYQRSKIFLDPQAKSTKSLFELSADPANPGEGKSVIWQSDGTGAGDDGDIMVKITAGGVTKTITLIDFSAF